MDRCLGSRKVVQALLAVGVKAEAHDDYLPPNYLDQDWLVEVSVRGWVVLTQDRLLSSPPVAGSRGPAGHRWMADSQSDSRESVGIASDAAKLRDAGWNLREVRYP